jgi:hypothetical protein
MTGRQQKAYKNAIFELKFRPEPKFYSTVQAGKKTLSVMLTVMANPEVGVKWQCSVGITGVTKPKPVSEWSTTEKLLVKTTLLQILKGVGDQSADQLIEAPSTYQIMRPLTSEEIENLPGRQAINRNLN